MPYTGSKGSIAQGATVGIGSTPVLIGEVNDIQLSGRQVGSESTTNFSSLAEEFVPTLLTSGSWTIKGNAISGDVGQVALLAALIAVPAVLKPFTITLLKNPFQTTLGDVYTFSALVESFDVSLNPKKVTTFDSKLKVSGQITFTPGS